jgi:hypothetical protein
MVFFSLGDIIDDSINDEYVVGFQDTKIINPAVPAFGPFGGVQNFK